ADFEAGRAANQNRALAHPRSAAAVGSADLAAGVAANADESAGHLGPDPIRGVARHFDDAALQARSQVHACVADDCDPSAGHVPADPLDLARVTVDLQLVACGPLDGEELVQPKLPLPEEHGQGADGVV